MIGFTITIFAIIMWFAIFDASPFIALSITFGIAFGVTKLIKAIKRKK